MTKEKKKLTKGLILVIVIVFLSAFVSLSLLQFSTPFQILAVFMFILFAVIGIGLVRLNNLARIILINLYILAIVTDLVSVLIASYKFGITSGLALALLVPIRIFIGVLVIIYLKKPKIKSLFN